MEFDSSSSSNHEKIEALLKENQRLLIENNTLLRKMRKTAIISSVLRFLWFLLILGAMFYTYITYIKPNFDTIKSKVDTLGTIVPDSTTLKEFYNEIKPNSSSPD